MLTAVTALDAVFTPRRVAVVGASDRPGTVGRLVWDNLAGLPGEVVPVSRTATVGGRPAYPDLAGVPGELDLAVVAVPAEQVPGVISAAARRRLPAAVILSAGFAETGPAGAALQDKVLEAARAGGVRLVGPNCFGVQNCDLPLNASIATGLPAGAGHGQGGISLVTQSGSYGMAVHALGRDESMRFAKVYAAGNAADLSAAEVLTYLRDDPATGVICLLLESITDPRGFFEAARRASAVKPVIATVTGRSATGQRAAGSHTAALAANEVLRDAALRQAGVVRTPSGLRMLDAARALSAQPFPAGGRVAIVTNSGGTGVELVDLLVDEGLEVPELSGRLRDELAALLPRYASARNPVDITPVWPRFTELYPALLHRLARSGEVDVVVPVLLQRAASKEVAAAVRDAVAELRTDGVSIPVYACWVAPRSEQSNADLLQEAGIPCLPWPDRTAQAIGAAVRAASGCRPAVAGPAQAAPPGQTVLPEPGVLPGRGVLSEPDALPVGDPDPGDLVAVRDYLAGVGIPVTEAIGCRAPAEAVAAADRLGYPVVLKVLHPVVSHKSDIGGVRLGLTGPQAVRVAAGELAALAAGANVLVQPQREGLELAVGGVRDAGYGPAVLVGLGGIHVEVLDDVRFALAPVTVAEASGLLRSLRGAALLDGVRGAPAVDVTAVAELVAAVGHLMVGNPRIQELDLNPVLAGERGCCAVDWRLRLDSAGA